MYLIEMIRTAGADNRYAYSDRKSRFEIYPIIPKCVVSNQKARTPNLSHDFVADPVDVLLSVDSKRQISGFSNSWIET